MGRCLLRLQQYERLMKVLLVHHELRGPGDELLARRAARAEKFADRSLGQLVKALFESYVVVEGAEQAVSDDPSVSTDRISMGIRFQMEMSDEHRSEVKAAIEDLIRLRNDLVHHLIERFDVWTDDGCAAAVEHLQHSYERIDTHFDELRHWAEHLGEAERAAASFVQSQAFQDLVINGIAPDGAVDWPRAGIVRALRDALNADSADGWSRLDVARAWLGRHHPEQIPGRYGCRSWPQVLSESREFTLEYRMEGDRRVAWFRERQ